MSLLFASVAQPEHRFPGLLVCEFQAANLTLTSNTYPISYARDFREFLFLAFEYDLH
jgi:hypothetical protein